MRACLQTILVLVVATGIGACSGGSDGGPDDPGASQDVAADATLDTPTDAAPDAADLGDPGKDLASDPGADLVPDVGTDVAPDAGTDVPDTATDTATDVAPDVPPAGCGEGGVCVEAGEDCPAAWMVMTQKGCTTPAGHDTGSCCIVGGECQVDADCPGCQLCDLPAAGPRTCVDPFGAGGHQCTTRLDCPDQYCCSYTRFADKPACGGMCVFNDGTADCNACGDEGMELSPGGQECCPGLERIPMPIQAGDLCIPSRCFCDVCVKHCGDGVCSAGENACTCPSDCLHTFAKGPGAPCASDADCASPGGCLPEASGYPAGGYCSGGACDPEPDPLSAGALCPAGSACTGTWFAQAYLCLPTCRKDADCRDGLTCQAFPEPYAKAGTLRCWQAGGSQPAGLGQACAQDDDCLSHLCLAAPGGAKVCTAFCDDSLPCREGLACRPMGGCGSVSCGACFAPAFRVSECGGFAAKADTLNDYCAQGVLDWHRDTSTGNLVMTDRRVFLNCCGEHSATVSRDAGTWVITEVDAPEGLGARCNCMCVFDFQVAVPGFPDGPAQVRILRYVTDSGVGPTKAWEGGITVTAAPGSVVIDDQPVAFGCSTP